MTLNAKIGVFMDFWAPKSIETDMEKLHMEFSA